MSDKFEPYKADRPPRSEGWSEETEEIIKHVKDRGDQRIGQYLLKAVVNDERYSNLMKRDDISHKEAAEQVLWNIEAPELLEAIEKLEEKRND